MPNFLNKNVLAPISVFPSGSYLMKVSTIPYFRGVLLALLPWL